MRFSRMSMLLIALTDDARAARSSSVTAPPAGAVASAHLPRAAGEQGPGTRHAEVDPSLALGEQKRRCFSRAAYRSRGLLPARWTHTKRRPGGRKNDADGQEAHTRDTPWPEPFPAPRTR